MSEKLNQASETSFWVHLALAAFALAALDVMVVEV